VHVLKPINSEVKGIPTEYVRRKVKHLREFNFLFKVMMMATVKYMGYIYIYIVKIFHQSHVVGFHCPLSGHNTVTHLAWLSSRVGSSREIYGRMTSRPDEWF
jgi:hypothetical protein